MSGYSIANQRAKLRNGTELAYFDSGEVTEHKLTIVLIHGYLGSSAYWQSLLPQLTEMVRVIAVDLRGHGDSSAPEDESYSMDLYAEEIADLMDLLEVKQAIMLGHSMGGYITLAAAEKYSDKLAAFGLIHSTAWSDTDEAKQKRDLAVAALQQDGVASYVHTLVPKLFAPANWELMTAHLLQAATIGNHASLHGAIASAKGMKSRPDRKLILEQTELPVLLVAGKEDQIISPDRTFTVHRSSIVQEILQCTGHMGMMEQPEELARIIINFVQCVLQGRK